MLDLFAKKEAPIQGMMGMGGGVPSRLLTLASGAKTYIEDVFSTYLHKGTGANQTITNGIDLAGEGGMVWIKSRSQATDHSITDTERGTNKDIFPNQNYDEENSSSYPSVREFRSDGFGIGMQGRINYNNRLYCSWTFRKCPGFFDIVTYTGNGSAGRTIAHNLGSVPGSIWVKRTDNNDNWTIYHRGMDSSSPEDYGNYLNINSHRVNSQDFWADTAPTDSVFSVGNDSKVNGNNYTYVAYLFAHNDGSFGESSDEAVIKCGSWTGTASLKNVDVGFEPQWLIVTSVEGDVDNWYIYDSMRGFNVSDGVDSTHLRADGNYAEGINDVHLTSTGFQLGSADTNKYGARYIYIAIRRQHKPPEAGTEVYETVKYTGNATARTVSTSIAADTIIAFRRSGSQDHFIFDRLRGSTKYLRTSTPAEELLQSSAITTIGNNFLDMGGGSIVNDNQSVTDNMCLHMFRRAPGFFDTVCYDGTGVARTQAHNLGVEPELIIVKARNVSTEHWWAYSKTIGAGKALKFNGTNAEDSWAGYWNNTAPTSSVFSLATYDGNNGSSKTYVAYLFATLSGISMVGSYSGDTNNARDVDCGFASNARFVMIKRTDSTGDWYVWDSVRGIVSGNDPYSLLNATAAEVTNTDYIDAHSSNTGFRVNSGTSGVPAALNVTGGTYIFLAIA